MSYDPNNPDSDLRRARSEAAEHSATNQRISRLEAVVDSLAGDIGRITAGLDSLSVTLQQRGQTQWGNIFAGLTLVVILVTGYVGLPLKALDAQLAQFRESVGQGQTSHEDIHEKIMARLRSMEAAAAVQNEKIFSLERNTYIHPAYRSGRPVPSPEDPAP